MTTSRYINRELSWLEFNQRVLDEARNPDVPLLERLKFLAITASNLDEFFMVRAGSLHLLVKHGITKLDPSGLTPHQQLEAIASRVRQMVADQYACLQNELDPGLAAAGLVRIRPEELTELQAKALQEMFDEEIVSVLTPQAVKEPDEFPLLVNQCLTICVRLAPSDDSPVDRFAVIPLLGNIHRFRVLRSEHRHAYILVEDVIRRLIQRFFVGEDVREVVSFRISRNADMGVREDASADLLSEMEELLWTRKQGDAVRLEVASDVSRETLQFLHASLKVGDQQTYLIDGPLDLASFMRLAGTTGFDHLRYDSWPPQPSPLVDRAKSMFEILAERDVLLYHPYESYDPVVRLVEEAADDPDVLAIKQTLYRTSRDSPIIAALRRAAENGKNVTALLELKARFDEARNIGWAKRLEEAAVQVIYGVKGLKTHAKICVIVRREADGIKRYMHFGTGNYNEATATLYSDVSYMTCDDDYGVDASAFFNAITGFSQPQQFRKIEAAPIGLREKILELIDTETQQAREGQPAHIVAKLNSLVDPEIIDALYEASQAGVQIQLNIRGICCLRPGEPGLSDNITVVSIVDRFLEHARILYFFHGGEERIYISSADWMPRNLDKRVELLVPIEEETCHRRLVDVLHVCFIDSLKGRLLNPDGSYVPVEPEPGEPAQSSQQTLYEQAAQVAKEAARSRRTVFEPHRAASVDD